MCIPHISPNRELCPVPEPDNIAAGSGTGYSILELAAPFENWTSKLVFRVKVQGLDSWFRMQSLGQVTIIIIRFQNRTAGSRTGHPLLEPDKVLDWDRTYIQPTTSMTINPKGKKYNWFFGILNQVYLRFPGTYN